MDCLKVSSKSSPASVAGAIAGMVKMVCPSTFSVSAPVRSTSHKGCGYRARFFDSNRF